MKRLHILLQALLLLAALVPRAWAQVQPEPNPYSKEQLAQLLAPVALYPDPLLSQILMASTYPAEVTEADRWMRQNPGLTGAALDDALQGMSWDASVKSLCHFPSVLAEMDRNLPRTTQLGDAFLARQDDVMDMVQELRREASRAGMLASNQQQTVEIQGDYILVEPAEPEEVYIPYYDPLVVYGGWPYPDYPPYAWFPGLYVSSGVVFSTGNFVGPAVVGWTAWNWRAHALAVNLALVASFNRIAAAQAGGLKPWTHDPAHRHGTAYGDPATARRFGRFGGVNPRVQREARGFATPGPGPAPSYAPLPPPPPPARPLVPGARPTFPGSGMRYTPPGGKTFPPGGPGTGVVLPPPRPGPRGQAPAANPFFGLSRHGGAFESQAAQRGAARAPAPGPAPLGRGPAPGPASSGPGGGGFHR